MADSGFTLEITCDQCGGTHMLPLDTSGHYSGPAPCDSTIRFELQIRPEQWRDMIERRAEEQVH